MTPCILVAFGDPTIAAASLDSFLRYSDELRLDLLENPDPAHGHQLERLAHRLIEERKIRRYIQFEENISNNARYLYLSRLDDLHESEFILVSDCDVLLPEGALEEQREIMRKHTNVFACGLRIDASLWPDELPVKTRLVERMNGDSFEKEDYVATATGFWSALFRSHELLEAMRFLDSNGRRFNDGNLKFFGNKVLHKHWVATKRTIGRELNREQPGHRDGQNAALAALSRLSPEADGDRYALWNHRKVSPYTISSSSGTVRIEPQALSPSVRRHRGVLASDVVFGCLSKGELEFDTGYFVKRIPNPQSPPGLYLVWQDKGVAESGYPRFTADKALVFVDRKSLTSNPASSPDALPRCLRRLVVDPSLNLPAYRLLLSHLLCAGGEITVIGEP